MTDSSTLSSKTSQRAMTDVTKADPTMTEQSPFSPYADLFDAADVASANTGRFVSVRNQIRTWVEAERCRYVAVGPGKVIRPRVFVAEVQTQGGSALLTRLFPVGEQYGRRLGTGDRIVVVLAKVWQNRRLGSGWEDRRRARKCYLFRGADE